MQAFSFLCALLLLFLTFEVCILMQPSPNIFTAKVNQGNGKKHFLIEVEDGKIENTDNGAIKSEKTVDGASKNSGVGLNRAQKSEYKPVRTYTLTHTLTFMKFFLQFYEEEEDDGEYVICL